jgi:hypothetical protein
MSMWLGGLRGGCTRGFHGRWVLRVVARRTSYIQCRCLGLDHVPQMVHHPGVTEKTITRRGVGLPTDAPLRNSLNGSILLEIPRQRDPRRRYPENRCHEHSVTMSPPSQGCHRSIHPNSVNERRVTRSTPAKGTREQMSRQKRKSLLSA